MTIYGYISVLEKPGGNLGEYVDQILVIIMMIVSQMMTILTKIVTVFVVIPIANNSKKQPNYLSEHYHISIIKSWTILSKFLTIM